MMMRVCRVPLRALWQDGMVRVNVKHNSVTIATLATSYLLATLQCTHRDLSAARHKYGNLLPFKYESV